MDGEELRSSENPGTWCLPRPEAFWHGLAAPVPHGSDLPGPVALTVFWLLSFWITYLLPSLLEAWLSPRPQFKSLGNDARWLIASFCARPSISGQYRLAVVRLDATPGPLSCGRCCWDQHNCRGYHFRRLPGAGVRASFSVEGGLGLVDMTYVSRTDMRKRRKEKSGRSVLCSGQQSSPPTGCPGSVTRDPDPCGCRESTCRRTLSYKWPGGIVLAFLLSLSFKICPSPTLQRLPGCSQCIASGSETFRAPNGDEIQRLVSPKLDPSPWAP